MFHTKFVYMFMMYSHIKIHLPISNSSLVIARKWKAKY